MRPNSIPHSNKPPRWYNIDNLVLLRTQSLEQLYQKIAEAKGDTVMNAFKAVTVDIAPNPDLSFSVDVPEKEALQAMYHVVDGVMLENARNLTKGLIGEAEYTAFAKEANAAMEADMQLIEEKYGDFSVHFLGRFLYQGDKE